jgi:predicted phosphoribosyltransferase
VLPARFVNSSRWHFPCTDGFEVAWLYDDRADAGRTLAALLADAELPEGLLVVALLRGGLPVARPIADRLGAELRALPVCKVTLEGDGGTVGALACAAGHEVRLLDYERLDALRVPEATIEALVRAGWAKLEHPEPPAAGLDIADACGRPLVLVDDGMMTGWTMRAATRAAFVLGASAVAVAAPVSSERALTRVSSVADLVVCPAVPEPMTEIGAWYRTYPAVSDAEVAALLRACAGGEPSRPPPSPDHIERR